MAYIEERELKLDGLRKGEKALESRRTVNIYKWDYERDKSGNIKKNEVTGKPTQIKFRIPMPIKSVDAQKLTKLASVDTQKLVEKGLSPSPKMIQPGSAEARQLGLHNIDKPVAIKYFDPNHPVYVEERTRSQFRVLVALIDEDQFPIEGGSLDEKVDTMLENGLDVQQVAKIAREGLQVAEEEEAAEQTFKMEEVANF